eukprot:TRINITY_DN2946_c0_g1_i1.p1 TRINITY_DN2946_c0_g1~~TRINITY_DN2946_c0_g1_i1.p1  ORF type:complete len:161 (-),score=21.20 TRINITY_DN2946_c0_g1_i1:18-500(-)
MYESRKISTSLSNTNHKYSTRKRIQCSTMSNLYFLISCSYDQILLDFLLQKINFFNLLFIFSNKLKMKCTLTTSVDVHPIGLNTGTIPLRFMLLSIFLLLSYYSIKQSLPPPLSLSLLSLSSFIFQHNPLFDTKMIPPPFVFYCQIYSRVVLIYTRVINR